jgi:hypothetical protein
MTPQAAYEAIDRWIDTHFDEEVAFLQALIRVPTDTPPWQQCPTRRTHRRVTGRHGPGGRKARGARG